MSPGTSTSASTRVLWPSRMTSATTGISSRMAAAAFEARSSCAKLKTPLMSTTRTMATASCGMPPIAARAAAIQSIIAKKWVS